MSTDNICPVCKNPKSTTPGSLTQWIAACSCDATPLEEEEFEQIKINICKICGKRVGEGRSGSFTQFIFRSDTCQCNKPVIDDENNKFVLGHQETTGKDLVSTASEVTYEDADEEELSLHEPDKFPIERYKPVRLLGSGATGAVYLARDKLLNKLVSVKILSNFNSKTIMAFQNEAKSTVQLSHPSIIEILDFGVTASETPFMVLEYFPGISLEEELKKKNTLDWEDIRAIFAQICDAIAYANENNIYHRDIKPSNILILNSNPENVRLIDFGIASIENTHYENPESQNTGLVGTPLYMSPEASAGKPYDSRSEVYSLSCVIYKSFTGNPPFQGETVLETLTMHKESPRPKIDNPNNREFLKQLNSLIYKGMAINPNDRFLGAKELKEELLSVKSSDITIDTTTNVIDLEKPKPSKKGKSLTIAIIGCFVIGGGLIFTLPNLFTNKKNEITKPVVEVVDEISEIPHEEDVLDEMKSMDYLGKKWMIEKTTLRGIEVTDEDFKMIKPNPAITSLRINGGSTQFTGKGFKYILDNHFNKIEILSIAFNDEGAKAVSSLAGLRKLSVQQNHALTIDGIKQLIQINGLKFLSFRFMTIPEGTAKLIAKSKSITGVEFGHIENITQKDIEIICTMPQLDELLIADAKVGDSIIPVLMQRNLVQLSINGTNITDLGLKELEKMKSLKYLKLRLDNGITRGGYQRFKMVRPDCRVKLDSGFSIGKDGLEEVRKFTLPRSLK